jgi:nucleotide-binding universal stress UspA family protein
MKPFQTILFAADFSEGSQEAFRAACSLAVEGETRLHVFHVVEPQWVPEDPVPYGQAAVQYDDAGRDGGRDETLRRRMYEVYIPNCPVDVEYHTSEGDASTEIVHMADEIEANLIVVGTHGRTGLSWLLAGSVATAVLRRAHCPVMAVHSSDRPFTAEETRVILHPTDFSADSEDALRVARTLARELGTRLILLHVAPFDVLVNDMVVPVDPKVYHDALEEVRQRVDGPDLKYPVESRLCRGDAAGEIIRMAGELECGLIVMGTHGRTGLRRLLMGSVAEYVLPRARCSVLAVKAPQVVSPLTSERSSQPAVTVF